MYLLLVAIRLQMSDLIPNYPPWGSWAFLELHCHHFQAPQLFCPWWIPLSLEKEKRLYVYPLFHFYFVLKRIISLMKLKAFLITETRMYLPITALFNYMRTLNFKSQLTIIFIYCIFHMFSIWRNEPWNTETHKTDQINQSKSQITNHDLLNFLKQASVFPKKSAKIIDSSKECKHRLAFQLRRWHVLKSAVKCMLNEHGDLQNKEVN